jgi:sigma-B regulation protein RsbQ
MVFAHGLGCDQDIWRFVAPCFERDHVTVLFDHVGAGRSQLSAYSSGKYSTLEAYADDLVELGKELELQNAVFVGHGYGAMIGALATLQVGSMFKDLVMIGPSARYINDDHYTGGFSELQVDEILTAVGSDYVGWYSRTPQRPELSEELVESFGRLDSVIAKELLRAILRSDTREKLPLIKTRALIMQSRFDHIAPEPVGQYVHRHIAGSELVMLSAQGHFPHISAPADSVAAISDFLRRSDFRGGDLRRAPNSLAVSRPALVNPPAPIVERNLQLERQRHELQESVLSRMGELQLQLGRYDMYALSLHALLKQKLSQPDTERSTLRTRGAEIISLMQDLPAETRAHFIMTDLELRKLLGRHEISARHGAVIPGLRAGSLDGRGVAAQHPRDWFDQAHSSNHDIRVSLEAIERDILKVVSLCMRLSHCALAVDRALSKLA